MNRQEPYVGMPIILASFDEDRLRQNREQKAQAAAVSGTSGAATGMAAAAATARSTGSATRQEGCGTASASDCNVACSQSETRQPMALAMAYVPWQRWQETYPLEEGLHRGTIFPELDLPFEGKKKGGMRR